jgi:hypothetical protein
MSEPATEIKSPSDFVVAFSTIQRTYDKNLQLYTQRNADLKRDLDETREKLSTETDRSKEAMDLVAQEENNVRILLICFGILWWFQSIFTFITWYGAFRREALVISAVVSSLLSTVVLRTYWPTKSDHESWCAYLSGWLCCGACARRIKHRVEATIAAKHPVQQKLKEYAVYTVEDDNEPIDEHIDPPSQTLSAETRRIGNLLESSQP